MYLDDRSALNWAGNYDLTFVYDSEGNCWLMHNGRYLISGSRPAPADFVMDFTKGLAGNPYFTGINPATSNFGNRYNTASPTDTAKIFQQNDATFGTKLTLTDNTDLQYFEGGDEVAGFDVSGVNNALFFDSNPGKTGDGTATSSDQYYRGNAFDGDTATAGFMAAATPVIPINYSTSVEVLPGGNIGGAGINRGRADAVEQDFVGDEVDNIWQTVATGSGTIHSFNAGNTSEVSTYIYAWRIDGVIVVGTEVDRVYVNSANATANTLTVSGGTWNNGDTATGPIKLAEDQNKFVLDLASTDETSPKRWITNAGKFVKGAESLSPDAAPEVIGVVDVPTETDTITGLTVVDAWDQSQIWRNSTTSSDGTFSSASGNAFDGNISTYAASGTGGSNTTLTLAPSTSVPFSQSLEVWCDQSSEIPIASWDGNVVNPGRDKWVTVYTGSGTLSASTPLIINTLGANEKPTLNGVRVDGKILVDTDFGSPSPTNTFLN